MPHRPLHILLVGINPSDALQGADEALMDHSRFTVRTARRLDEGLELLAAGHFDAVLLNLGLPGDRGLDTLRSLRRASPHIPIIVLTGRDDEELVVTALHEGAQDYLVKGRADFESLRRSVRYAVERRQGEERLRQGEEWFRGAFEHTNVPMVVTDTTNRFVRVNEAFARMFGYRSEEMLNMTMLDVTHPEDVAESLAQRERLLAGAAHHFQLEKRYRHRDGRILWGLTNVSLVRDPSGEPLVYIGQVQDVTERKRAEEALREARQRLEHVVTSSPAVIFTLVVDGGGSRGLSWVSDNVRELTGYTPTEVLRPGWWPENIHPDDRDRVVAETDRDLLATGRAASEYRFRHRNGTYRWARNEMRLVRDDAGKPVEAVGSWSDVTDQKRLEEQFRHAQKIEAVGRLAAGVAHDFNNLLTVIIGYGQLLLDQLPKAELARELVREMTAAGERAAGLTAQLLAFSRKAVIEPRVLDLNEVVSQSERLLRRLIGEDVTLTIAPAPTPALVKVDPTQIEQVIVNLAVNARDAMPTGGWLTVETREVRMSADDVRAYSDLKPGRYVQLAVSDTGTGMTSEVKARVFEPFFTTKEPGKGTGLGLATVFGIVKTYGGHVGVYSEVGLGTTFKILLPAATGVPTPPTSGEIKLASRGTETILLVEDEDGVRALARVALESQGYKVVEAPGGAEALLAAEEYAGPIHLLVTDVVMPGMGGRAVAEGVRGRHPGIKVLYVSGYTDDAVVRHGVIAATDAFLQKPFTPLTLARKVRTVLDGTP